MNWNDDPRDGVGLLWRIPATRTAAHRLLVLTASVLCVMGVQACDDEGPAPDRGVPGADVDTLLPDIGVQFGSDGAGEDAATDDLDSTTADETSAADAHSSGPILSCNGHCGVYLEDNPCHCHAGCAAEGNCCGGATAFGSTCACAKPADCDDDNACTADSCLDAICRQIPVGGNCCQSDSECSGGDACTAAKCLDSACTLVPKDCDDKLSCTVDACADGVCSHSQSPNTCYVEGLCYAAGASGSAGCGTCDPAKSTTALSPPPGKCQIDGECYAAGPAPNLSCAYCDSANQPTAWTVKVGWCVIDGQCIEAGATHPTATCLQCKPDVSKSNWTILDGFCHIDGACVPAKQGGDGGCKICEPTVNPVAWTTSPGAACSLPCVTNATCQNGLCVGTKQPASQCCTADAECQGQVGGLTVCQEAVCNLGTNKCGAQTKQDCCYSGVCCNTATNTYKPAGSDCSGPVSDKEKRCAGDTIEIRDVHAGCTGNHQSSCSDAYPFYGPWTVYLTCSNGPCVIDSGTGGPKCSN